MGECIVVWCDSPLGLISTRVDSLDIPIRFPAADLHEEIAPIKHNPKQVFDILKKKDGKKIAIPVSAVSHILGWTI